jgi:CopG family transcriptional regulator/antitoxin EndoAI
MGTLKTIQMTLDEKLLQDVDTMIDKLKTNRSEFIRQAMSRYLEEIRIQELEKIHHEGYMKHPVTKDEFDIWQDEQSWI